MRRLLLALATTALWLALVVPPAWAGVSPPGGNSSPTGGQGTYTGISNAKLVGEAPGVSPTVTAAVKTASNQGYCMQSITSGSTYHYEGGTGGASVIATGACPTGYGTQA